MTLPFGACEMHLMMCERRIQRIIKRLKTLGYRFTYPQEVMPGPVTLLIFSSSFGAKSGLKGVTFSGHTPDVGESEKLLLSANLWRGSQSHGERI